MGDAGSLVELDARLRRPNLIGDTTWLTGEVKSKDRTSAGARASCRVAGTNQRGETTITATAIITLPSRGGSDGLPAELHGHVAKPRQSANASCHFSRTSGVAWCM